MKKHTTISSLLVNTPFNITGISLYKSNHRFASNIYSGKIRKYDDGISINIALPMMVITTKRQNCSVIGLC